MDVLFKRCFELISILFLPLLPTYALHEFKSLYDGKVPVGKRYRVAIEKQNLFFISDTKFVTLPRSSGHRYQFYDVRHISKCENFLRTMLVFVEKGAGEDPVLNLKQHVHLRPSKE